MGNIGKNNFIKIYLLFFSIFEDFSKIGVGEMNFP